MTVETNSCFRKDPEFKFCFWTKVLTQTNPHNAKLKRENVIPNRNDDQSYKNNTQVVCWESEESNVNEMRLQVDTGVVLT